MNDLAIRVNYDADRPTVIGRDLHAFLGVETAYKDWFPRMCEYGFAEDSDYSSFLSHRSDGLPGKPRTDHQLTVDMAKELCMLQRTERGKQCRQYFLELERQWNTPESVMSRALRMANAKMEQLAADNSRLAVQVQINQPKADYFDALVDRNLLTNFRDTAKAFCLTERVFINYLLDKKYIYRAKRGRLMPMAGKGEGLFEVKETMNDKTGWSGVQTLITPKGRETFRLLTQGMV